MDLRVMTFNIRNGIADDGTSSWQFRKHLLVRAVRSEMPDVLGLQEVFWHQRAFLWQALPEYEQFGEHRDGGREEEAALICYRHDRITLLEAGNLWLSETPEVAGSRDWGTHHARMASWARLCRRSDQARMLFINCHLDNQAEEARQHSALLLRDLATRKAEGDPVVLVGDFNTGPDTRTHALLVADADMGAPFQDAWRLAGDGPESEPTYHGWTPNSEDGERARIDWVLVSPRVRVSNVTRPKYREGNRLPSDHYPVLATIDLGAGGPATDR